MPLTHLLLLLAAGLAAGTVNAVAGGGSLITFPALLATGLGTIAANVTNSVAVSPGYVASVYGSRHDLGAALGRRPAPANHTRPRPPSWPSRTVLFSTVATAAVGSFLGCELLLHTSPAAFGWVVPFLVLAASATLALQPRLRQLAASRGTATTPAVSRRTLALHGVVGATAIYGGYFGAALGVMLVAGLALILAEPLGRINAIKNAISAVVGLVTVVVFALSGPVDWADVAVVAPAALLGGYLGARLASRLPARTLRTVIVTFGTAVGVYLLIRAAT